MLIQTYNEPTNWKPGKALSPYQVIDKEEAHKQRLLHLSTHLLIRDFQGNICVRKRETHEERYTSLWTTALGTHVSVGKDYSENIKELLPISLDLEWVGEFRVKDYYENEVCSLFITASTPNELGDAFMNGRYFLTLDEIVKEIIMNQTTPHLKKSIKLFARI